MLDLGFFSRSRVRLVRQTEVAECGLASLTMIANYHGLDVDLGTMRRRFAPSLRGAALRTLIGLADRIGLTPRAVKLPLEELGNLHMPAVLHWDMNHYVVIEQVKAGKALIHNPEGSSKWMPMDEVSHHFTGVALELRPSDNFETGSQRERLKLSHLWRNMSGLKRALLQVFVLSIVLQAYVLALPYYMQIAIDRALPEQNLDLLAVLAVGFGIFALIQAGASILRSFVLLFAGSTLGYTLSSNIARRLFRLPVDWFEKRHTGDILSRFQSIAPIRQLLTEGAVAAVLDGMLAILTLVVMFFYSTTLAFIAIAAFALYGVVRAISFSMQKEAQEASIIAGGKEQTTLIESLRGITTLRLFGRETLRHALWQTKLTDAVNANVRLARIGIWQQTGNALIFALENIITVYLAVSFVIEGAGFSVGMVFAYMSYKTQFIQKSAALIDQFIAFRMLSLHLERLSDIALTEEDRSFEESPDLDTPLKGGLELKNVFYRYSPSDPMVLDGVDLKIEPGEHVAITGPSGGGKSTMMKIMLGLVDPDSGEVLVDGMPLKRFGHRSYYTQIAAVLQEDTLFAGSLSDNIALFDEKVDQQRVMAAAHAASIHADIAAMPMQYETLVGDMGSTLSGGQKQRVLLARALYRQPKILLMDEGTAHLDTVHEQAVNAAIASMGITRIIIAHRKETIESADRIVVVHGGKVHQPEMPAEGQSE
ncbi:peptidase domain-containing ABC transporter [Alteriqipengyuania sp. WL0013]|uniref:peptidase domain-containing ABC transporter n=1 Tax=Alteriqipengyuania sp. WL0013 TaxID=3110773 RepID=UPI002B9411DF|nr:peptidase domain-containing ABC transporter [Alteriqipengyuania sp. WL0013]MEB3416012.1 peptidase domain-containing ABC transporter [Alteriqipengyuania sp. WL0013]